jgi:hypothetical protein
MTSIFTRSALLTRASAVAGGTAAWLALGRIPVALGGKTAGTCSVFKPLYQPCRTQWGPPNCVESCVTVYSPNDSWWGRFCCDCTQGFCSCEPQYVQVKATVCNNGGCAATCVPA